MRERTEPTVKTRCRVCGRAFLAKKNRKLGRWVEVCSRSCQAALKMWRANRVRSTLKDVGRQCRVIERMARTQGLCVVCGRLTDEHHLGVRACTSEHGREHHRVTDRVRRLGTATLTVVCPQCGAERAVQRNETGRARFCSDACRRAAERQGNARYKMKRRAAKRTSEVEDVDRVVVIRRDLFRCQSCGCRVRTTGDPTHPNYAHVDHVIPLAAGGPHRYDNVQLLCRSCNMAKGATVEGQMRLSL